MGYIEELKDAYDVEIERDSVKILKTRAVIDDGVIFKKEDGIISKSVDYITFSYGTDIRVNDHIYITDPRLSETYNQPFIVCSVEDSKVKDVEAKIVEIRLLSEVREKYPFGSVEKFKK